MFETFINLMFETFTDLIVVLLLIMLVGGMFWIRATARPDRNESGFPRHAGGASLTH